MGGHDITYHAYNFTGNITKTLKEHNIAGQSTVTELYEYAYDHTQRLKTTSYKLNNKPSVILSSNTYDELGRLVEKKRHSNADTEEFEYNIRGWATKIKSGDFEQNLYYNTGLPQGATACYNGNIAYSTWKYNSFTSGYEYQYDELNRLTDSYFKDVNSNNYYDNGCYDERFIFDKQGNIKTITRTIYGSDVDYLTLSYIGNQLTKVTDGEGSWASYNIKEYHDKANLPLEFFYDPNGNLTKDFDRNIDTIKYNLLNLPDTIQFSNGNQIVHTYDAGGRKLRTEYFTLYTPIQIPLSGIYNWNNRWDVLDTWEVKAYVGNFEYHQFKDSEDDYYSLIRINNTEGYVTSLTSPSYNYYRKDHVGNNREVWKAVANATIQRTQYYPSGLPIEFNNGDNPGSQPYKYGGKEFVEMHGLDEYDSEARWYYPAIMRTTTMDPHCENYYDTSPYAWCGNNPVNRIDPDGRDWFVNNDDGNVVYLNGISEITQELSEKYGLGDVKRYENLGKDNMFGEELVYGGVENILDREILMFNGEYFSEKFMSNHGYEKAEKVKIEEQKITTVDSDGFSARPKVEYTYNLNQVGKSRISYATPEKINNKENFRERVSVGNRYKTFIEIEGVSYNLTKPHGQSNYKTAYYKEQRRAESVNNAIKGVSLTFDVLRTIRKR